MSRSKREVNPTAPASRRALWQRPAVRLALAVAAVAVVRFGLRLGLGAGLATLFRAWNVRADNAQLAPAWARLLYVWQGSAVTLLVNLAVIGLCVWGFHVRVERPRGGLPLVCFAAGACAALLSAALFLLTDSLRLLWPIGEPRLSAGLWALGILSLIGALAESVFTKGLVYERARRWGILPAMALSTLAFFLSSGGYAGSVISGINVALMGLLGCLVYERHGLWADVMLRWGWSFAAVFLLGQGGGDRAVYRLYGVSETLLTGGDGGLVYGLWLTLLLAAAIGICAKRTSRKA